VAAGGGEDGVGAVARSALEIVAVHAVLGLDVADHRLDGGAAYHLAADGVGHAPHLAADPHLKPVRVVVAAIAFIDMDALRLDAGELGHIGDHRSKRVAVVGNAVRRLGAHTGGERQQRTENLFARSIALDLAPDVADQPAEPCAQELGCAPGGFELMRVDVAARTLPAAAGDGRFGEARRRYPGGTEKTIILATIRGSIPNRRAASRGLDPSIWTV
jgi:hypothetical protein